MFAYSKTIIIGNITRDLELQSTSSGTSYLKFSVAVSRPFKDKETGKNPTDFYTCVAWGRTAENISSFFGKGKPIVCEGAMENRKWTGQDGEPRNVWELRVDRFAFIGNKDDQTQTYGAEPAIQAQPSRAVTPSAIQFDEEEDPFAD